MKQERNDKCQCGSGKKYKKCCLPKDEANAKCKAAMVSAPDFPNLLCTHEFHRNAVEAMDFGNFLELFGPDASMLKAKRGAVVLSVTGYGDDPRELWQIPEVLAYFKELHKRWDYSFYFLSPRPLMNGFDFKGFWMMSHFVSGAKLPDGNWTQEFDNMTDEDFQRLVGHYNWIGEDVAEYTMEEQMPHFYAIMDSLQKPYGPTKPVPQWALKK